MKRKYVVLIAALALTLLISGVSQAANINLSDANSTLTINTGPAVTTGVTSWVVDGLPQLFQSQWFIGFGSNTQIPVSDFGSTVTAPPPANFADITYIAGRIWTLDATYTLSGGAAGTRMSDLAQQATFNNISGVAQQLRLYLYADFDLVPPGLFGDTVTISGNHHAVQTGKNVIEDTVLGPDASRVEANFFANTLHGLDGGAAYLLNNNTSAGPGDVTWAFEWDVTVSAGGSFQVSLDNFIAPVPVPPAVLLFGSGLLGLVGLRRFRKG